MTSSPGMPRARPITHRVDPVVAMQLDDASRCARYLSVRVAPVGDVLSRSGATAITRRCLHAYCSAPRLIEPTLASARICASHPRKVPSCCCEDHTGIDI